MDISLHRLFVSALLLAAAPTFALTHYVDVNSTNPVPPYTNWATAANVIQDAVDAASSGDTVLVTNGVYDTGGSGMNRVAVNKALTLVSASGPELTVIRGAKAVGGGNGDSAMRCVYLSTGASLIGFTLTNGATRTVFDPSTYQSGGGGLWCPTTDAWVSNCILVGNSAHDWGGGAVNGTLYRCTLQNNSAGAGGGIVDSILVECRLEGNSAGTGGGAWRGTLVDCALVANTASGGGGATYGALTRCLIASNSASGGGGVIGATLRDCTLVGNRASSSGGGAGGGTLKRCLIVGNSAYTGGGVSSIRNNQYLENCVLVGNRAELEGGAAVGSRLAQCTVVGNSARLGGGVSASSLTNSIVFFNSASDAGENYWMSHLIFCCATPLPTSGTGNITNAPLFMDTNGWADLRLQSNSPCINAGNNSYVATTTSDFDENPRIVGGTVDIGAYEQQSPALLAYYNWLQGYNLPTDGSVDGIDGDGDRATTWQEWKMWTDPTNQLSVLKMLIPDVQTNGPEVAWQSVSGHSYLLERATNSAANFLVLQSNIIGQAGTTAFMDTTATNGDAFFYRVGVPE